MQGDFPNLLLCKGISKICCYARGFPKFTVIQGDFQNLLLCTCRCVSQTAGKQGVFPNLPAACKGISKLLSEEFFLDLLACKWFSHIAVRVRQDVSIL